MYQYEDNPDTGDMLIGISVAGALLFGGYLVITKFLSPKSPVTKPVLEQAKQEAQGAAQVLQGALESVVQDAQGFLATIVVGAQRWIVRLRAGAVSLFECKFDSVPNALNTWSLGDGRAYWNGYFIGNVSLTDVWTAFRQWMKQNNQCDPGQFPIVEFYRTAKGL